MKQLLTIPAAVALSIVLAAPATRVLAQAAPVAQQSERDHAGHHSDGGQAAAPAPAPPPQGGMMGMMGQQNGGQSGGGMMGGDMGRMMSMMRGGGGMMGGMPFEHVEGRIAFVKAELKITDAQAPLWDKLADTVRLVAESVKGLHQQTMQGQSRPSTAAHLERYEHMLSVRLAGVSAVRAAFDPLYASLSDEQQKTADELFGRMFTM
jgi:hypothetical protein